MRSSSLHHHPLVKKTKALLAGPFQQAMYLNLGHICVLSVPVGWTGWIGETNIKSSSPALLFYCTASLISSESIPSRYPFAERTIPTFLQQTKSLQEAPQSFWGRTFHHGCRLRSGDRRRVKTSFPSGWAKVRRRRYGLLEKLCSFKAQKYFSS